MASLSGVRILVTGGTGFIGSRIVDFLSRDPLIQVRVLVRDAFRASRLLRYDPARVELAVGDLGSPADVLRATEGCSVVVHAAFGTEGTASNHDRITVGGTKHVLEAAKKVGVTRVVHISTWQAYEIPSTGDLTERSPAARRPNLYARSKLRAEAMAQQYFEKWQVPVVIVQPTIVYGPGGLAWTVVPLNTMARIGFPLIDGGRYRCNAVYVDDVAAAVVLASSAKAPAGRRYLVSGGESVTWAEFLGFYASLVGKPDSVICLSSEEMRRRLSMHGRLGRFVPSFAASLKLLRERPELARTLYELPIVQTIEAATPRAIAAVRSLYGRPAPKASRIGSKAASDLVDNFPLQRIDRAMVEAMANDVNVDISAARRDLQYSPRFTLASGMARVESWWRYLALG